MTSRTSKSSNYKILNIRGANGCGKSWIVRKLMKESRAKPIYGKPEPGKLIGSVIGYEGNWKGDPIYFVGSYEVMSGGADHVMKHFGGLDNVDQLVRDFAGKGHVIFEGFIVSGLFSRFYKLSKELGGIVFCYMDTPLEVCLERIEQRNKEKTAASGRIKGSVGTKHVEQKFIEAERTRRKFKEAGERTVMVNHRRPMRAIYKVLGE